MYIKNDNSFSFICQVYDDMFFLKTVKNEIQNIQIYLCMMALG